MKSPASLRSLALIALFFVTMPRAHAGLLDRCLRYLFPPLRVDASTARRVLEVSIGDQVRVTTRRGVVEGSVIDNTLEYLRVGRTRIERAQIRSIEVVRRREDVVGDVPAADRAYREELLAGRRQFVRFEAQDFQIPVDATITTEIQALRAMPTREARHAYLRELGRRIVAALQARTGVRRFGYHFNLHGGNSHGYVDGGGIYALRGDSAWEHGVVGSLNERVYLFDSAEFELFDVLNESNPRIAFGGRMGSVLSLFSLESSFIERARAAGAIRSQSRIYLEFDSERLATLPENAGRERLIGIPYSSYLLPPLEVFDGAERGVPGAGRLSRDEETLVAMRYLESVIVRFGN